MSASLRNAVKRKTHKERSQPNERARYGLLEKKKDYVERAKDYHKKEDIIKSLKQKAAFRNPDEFYFAMEKARTKDGVHVGRQEEGSKYTPEQLRLMKTQDEGYLKMKAQAERKARLGGPQRPPPEAKKVEKLAQNLHLIGQQPAGKHTIFVDDGAEAKAFKPAEFFRTPEELLGRAFNRPTVDQLRERAAAPEGPQQEALLRKAQRGKPAAGYRELVARTNRLKALEAALEATEAEKAMMGKGRKRKIAPAHNVMVGRVGLDGTVEGDGPKVKRPAAFRWKAERKR